MANHFKVHELLSASELEELEKFAREPGRTVDECWDWLTERSKSISRGAVGNWKREFDELRLKERMSGSGALAKAFMDAARSGGGVEIPDAATLQIAQMVFEKGAELASGGDVSPDDLTKLSLALQRLTLAKARVEEVRADYEKRQKLAVEAASKVAREGGDGKTVVDKVREILGIGGKP